MDSIGVISMPKIGLLIICLLLGQFSFSQTQNRDGNLAAKQFLDSLKADKGLPAVSAAVSIQGKLIWSHGLGLAKLEDQAPATPNTVYRIASVSKLITTAAMLKLIGTGVLDLDKSINNYIDFPKGEDITLRQLASHSSGVRHYQYDEREDLYPHFASVSEAIDIFKNDPLVARPGEQYQYSSYGIDLIGAIIEKASSKSFESYVRKVVLKPLGMKNTFARLPQKQPRNLAKFYINQGEEVPARDLSYNIPGGGMYSTVKDLVKLGDAFLEDSFLPSTLKEEVFQKATLNNGDTLNYGLGWMIKDLENGEQVYYHGGHMDGTHSILLIVPEKEVSVSIIANRGSNFGEEEALALAYLFLPAEEAPDLVREASMDPQLVRQTFQNLMQAFSTWQTAVESKDATTLEQLVSTEFSSKTWATKKDYINFMTSQIQGFQISNQDFNLRGVEEGDRAHIRTIQFDSYAKDKDFYLVLKLINGQWQIIGMEAFKQP